MFCENCGAKLADNSKFCQRCGAPVRQEDNVPGQENSGSYSVPPQAPAKKKIRKWPFMLAGYDEPVIGTDFYGDPDAEEMADLLDDIGLEGMTSYMRDSYMMIFDFSADEYDEMLMFVTGENDGSGDQTAYYDNLFEGNTIPELLGKVVFTLQLSWDEPGDESSGQNSSDVPETPDYLGFFFRSSV